jgi:hypothetical protein
MRDLYILQFGMACCKGIYQGLWRGTSAMDKYPVIVLDDGERFFGSCKFHRQLYAANII